MIDPKFAAKVQAYPRVALVLQGGGALGSYQAGVYEGLAHAGIHPNWVAGISIGALNCAIIAGNAPEKRVEKLHEFWNTICSPPVSPAGWLEEMFTGARSTADKAADAEESTSGFNPMTGFFGVYSPIANPWLSMFDGAAHTMFGSMAAMSAIVNGQTGFFKPRAMAPGGGTPDQTSFYDTSPIIETLERFADFDRINSGETRVSLGATNVASGNFVYFDSQDTKLTPKHFIASGSLPPGFPATEIDGEYYWDGGCVSNTPLEYVTSTTPRKDTLVFQVDLWSAEGPLPKDIFQVNERLKDIQYSSRTRTVTNTVHLAQRMRKALLDTISRIPPDVREKDPWFQEVVQRMMGSRYNVIHLIYRNKASEGHYKDYEFSYETMRMHWQTGQHDMFETLAFPECLDMPAEGENFVTFDIHTRKRSSAQFNDRHHNPYAVNTQDSMPTDTTGATQTHRSQSDKPGKSAVKTAGARRTPAKSAVRSSGSRKRPPQDRE